MKKRTKEFIKTMNTQDYSHRLQEMIECEKVCISCFKNNINSDFHLKDPVKIENTQASIHKKQNKTLFDNTLL